MKRWSALLLLLTGSLAAQPPAQKLLDLADEVDAAIKAGDWTRAAKASDELRESAERARNDALQPANRKLADKILTWLPVDAQTFVVARQPFAVRAKDESAELPSALAGAQQFLLLPLGAAEEGKLVANLTGRVIQLGALTGRAFSKERPGASRRPELGPIPYEGCGVYAFVDQLPDSLWARQPEETVLGYRVWTSE